MNTKLFRTILLCGCVSILMGCVQTMPKVPIKPTLNSMSVNDAGGICLDRPDTAALAAYILELERGYQ